MKSILKSFLIMTIVVPAMIGSTAARPEIGDALKIETDSTAAFKNKSENRNDASDAINTRALKEFQKTFKQAIDVKWYTTVDGGYIASFATGEVKTSVAYDRKGFWDHTIRSYKEKQLPVDVRCLIKSTYYDYAIMGIKEVNFSKQVVYVVYLQDESHLKIIRVCDGETSELKNYIKG